MNNEYSNMEDALLMCGLIDIPLLTLYLTLSHHSSCKEDPAWRTPMSS
jgi:hypothetical protein